MRLVTKIRITSYNVCYTKLLRPLELWLLGYLRQNPDAAFSQVVADSSEQRLEVYGWLFRSRHKGARDRRIRILLENEAFSDRITSYNVCYTKLLRVEIAVDHRQLGGAKV